MNKIDLHIHTINSDDGEFSTQEIIDMAKQKNIHTIAIADHNCVKAYFEKKDNKGITLIPAIELDCHFQGKDFHLLGYGINIHDSIYEKIENDILKQEIEASKYRLRYAKEKLGLQLSEEVLKKRSKNGVYIGETICEAALEIPVNKDNPYLKEYYPNGKRSDNPHVNFYWDYFSQGKDGYTQVHYISMEEAISLYKKQGATVVLAHPGNNVKEDNQLLADIIALGIDGLEVYSSYHTLKQIDYYQQKAKENELIMTCGSDFHGRTKPSVIMGECGMPEAEEERLYTDIKKN